MPRTLREIAKLIGGELVGSGEVTVNTVNGINEAREGDLAFIISSKYEDLVDSTKASAVVVPKDVKKTFKKPVIKVTSPSSSFSKIIECLLPDVIPHPKGIAKTAVIAKNARIGTGVAVGPYTVIEDGASIGDSTVIYPFCYIGKKTIVGNDCIIYPNVTVREMITIGSRVIIHSGTVIGSDGFGYDIQPDGTHLKIPQLGTIVIEDDVELGACVTVDRARFAKTIIGKGTKIDNLCQIAHNVTTGPNCIIAAQSGISGSSHIGRSVVLGGQVGITDHVTLGDFVVAGAKTGVTKSFPSNTTLFWYPAKPVEKIREIIGAVGLLPKLFKKVNALEAKIKELENKK